MKTKFYFNRLLILLSVFAVIFITSCSKEEKVIIPDSDVPSGISLKDATIPTDDMICDLIAGQNISAGKVVYTHIDNVLKVEYVATDGWMLSEVHFYVGNMDDFEASCMNKKSVQIGKFPYSASDINDDTWSFEISLDGIDPEPDGSYLVVAHAVMTKGDQVETAFAKCDYFITTLKAKFVNDAGGTFFGESEGTPFIDYDPAYWCSYLGTNIYEGEDTYPIGSWGNYYGEVHFSDDGVNLMIDVTANAGLSLVGVWIYVGPLNGLQAYLSAQNYDGVCPEYWNFPISSFDGGTSNSFSVPLPNSTSFEDAFDITRWGWISYYKF